jgi:nucleotide-binding universal stress UspA family protein
MNDGRPVLICYNGSDDARAALVAAVEAFRQRVVVATYWQPFGEGRRPLEISLLELVQDPNSINEREQAQAHEVAVEGAALVEAAGGTAEAVAVKVSSPIDEAILTHAEEIDALAIVIGSQSRSGIGSILLGDVAGDIVQLSDRPVFVVPSAKLAGRRRSGRRSDAGAPA